MRKRRTVRLVPGEKGLRIKHIGMSSFVAASPGGGKVLIDPFLGDGPGEQKRLDPAVYEPADLEEVDAVLATHIHPDHYERATVETVQKKSEAMLLSTREVIDHHLEHGNRADLCRALGSSDVAAVHDFKVRAIACPDHRGEESPTSLGFRLGVGSVTLYHSGDTYRPGRDHTSLAGAVDVALLWPWEIEVMLVALRPSACVIMHYDRYEPGGFTCNIDPEAVRADLAAWFPSIEFCVLERGRWYSIRKEKKA